MTRFVTQRCGIAGCDSWRPLGTSECAIRHTVRRIPTPSSSVHLPPDVDTPRSHTTTTRAPAHRATREIDATSKISAPATTRATIFGRLVGPAIISMRCVRLVIVSLRTTIPIGIPVCTYKAWKGCESDQRQECQSKQSANCRHRAISLSFLSDSILLYYSDAP